MAFQSTKTYGTDRGLSCCFRQWRANHSHCSTLHGYSLGFKFIFESETLDEKNWCFDFGGMKPIKQYLDYMFDHTVLVAQDDPALEMFKIMAAYSTKDRFNGTTDHIGYQEPTPYELGRICDLRIVEGVGCEMTAKMVFEKSAELLKQMQHGDLGRYSVNPDVRLVSVECFEHAGNSAIYNGPRTFFVDVGDMPKEKTEEYLNSVKEEIHQRREPVSPVKAKLEEAIAAADAKWTPSDEAMANLEEAVKAANAEAVQPKTEAAVDPMKLLEDYFYSHIRPATEPVAKVDPNAAILEAIKTAVHGKKTISSSALLGVIKQVLKPTTDELDISAFGWELAELLKIPTKPKK